MKKLIIMLCIAHMSPAQTLIKIKAIGGGGKNINWAKINADNKAIDDANSDGPPSTYDDCSQGVTAVNASSTLPPQGKVNYKITNLSDGNPMTAWVEAKPDYGIGEWFEIKTVNVNAIFNGHQFSPSSWINNSRVKTFKVYRNNKPLCLLELTDEMGEQRFELPNAAKFENEATIKFEIVEVYKGLKWSDVAISGLDWHACCFAVNTEILSTDNTKKINELAVGNKIQSINLTNGKTKNVIVNKLAKQIHLSLLTIKTKNQSIQLTPSHPLYIKNYGFISLARLLNKLNKENYKELTNNIEVLIWNEITKKTEYEPLLFIEKIEGNFETYSILKLNEGKTYIANGFITQTY